MGLEGEQVHQSGSGWSPCYVQDNLAVMSCGFLLASLDDAGEDIFIIYNCEVIYEDFSIHSYMERTKEKRFD